MKEKNIKKWILNGLTATRVVTTLSMPILVSSLSSVGFLFLIGGVLLTDALDGFLARKWEVSTIFGSLFDMGADKLLGMSIFLVLSFTYPVMLIPLILELSICYVNTNNALKGNIAKSKFVGRIKMWIVGICMTSLLFIGAAPEISKFLSEVNVDVNLFKNSVNKINKNEIIEIASWLDGKLSIFKEKILNASKYITYLFINKKTIIENIVIPTSIISEAATLALYKKDSKKLENNEKLNMIEELKKYKEYVKEYGLKNYMNEVMLDNNYYTKTNDEPLVKKLKPNMNKVVDK